MGVSERVRWSRGAFHESPALELPAGPPAEAERIAALRSRYQVRFELELCAATSFKNFEYLDVLDRSWAAAGLAAAVAAGSGAAVHGRAPASARAACSSWSTTARRRRASLRNAALQRACAGWAAHPSERPQRAPAAARGGELLGAAMML